MDDKTVSGSNQGALDDFDLIGTRVEAKDVAASHNHFLRRWIAQVDVEVCRDQDTGLAILSRAQPKPHTKKCRSKLK